MKINPNIKGILFDMDGTVLDSEHLFLKSQIELLKEFNIEHQACDLEEFKGLSYKDFYPKFMKKFGIISEISEIREKLRTYLHELMETDLKFIPGFESFFKLHIQNKNYSVGLVTNTTRLSYQKIQTCINIDDYFGYVLTVSESIEPKPSPKPYFQAMDYLSLNFNQVVIIEDSKTGLISAKQTGATVIAITTSLNHTDIKNIDNDIIIFDSYKQISDFFS